LHPFVDLIKRTKHEWLLFEIYSIGEMYEDAIQKILDANDFKRLEEFCRSAPNPAAAFEVAFKQLKAGGRDILENGAEFLIRNIEWVDCCDMLEWLPHDVPLAAVAQVLQAASAYLIQKERIMTMKLKIGQSMRLDVEYRLVKAQLRNTEVQHNTVCQGCHRPVGDGWLAIAPDNRVYHMTCKPKLAPRP
jgi:hypothetical protein